MIEQKSDPVLCFFFHDSLKDMILLFVFFPRQRKKKVNFMSLEKNKLFFSDYLRSPVAQNAYLKEKKSAVSSTDLILIWTLWISKVSSQNARIFPRSVSFFSLFTVPMHHWVVTREHSSTVLGGWTWKTAEQCFKYVSKIIINESYSQINRW